MLSIGIKNLECWGFIGLHPEEQKVPNKIRFQIEVWPAQPNEFVDYTLLSTLAQNSLHQGFKLLEELAFWIRDEILKHHPSARLEISVEKCTPPTGQNINVSFVKWTS